MERYIRLYTNSKEQFEQLSGEECKTMLLALFDYKEHGKQPQFTDRALTIAWSGFRQQLDAEHDIYVRKCAAGKLGAAKRWQNIADDSKNSTPIKKRKDKTRQDKTGQENKDLEEQKTADGGDSFDYKKQPTECVFCQSLLIGCIGGNGLKCVSCGALYRNGKWKKGYSEGG